MGWLGLVEPTYGADALQLIVPCVELGSGIRVFTYMTRLEYN